MNDCFECELETVIAVDLPSATWPLYSGRTIVTMSGGEGCRLNLISFRENDVHQGAELSSAKQVAVCYARNQSHPPRVHRPKRDVQSAPVTAYD